MPTTRMAYRVAPLLLAVAVALGCCQRAVLAAGPSNPMIELSLQGQKLEGSPISWSRQEVHLLGRDGRLWQFDPDQAREFKQTAGAFPALLALGVPRGADAGTGRRLRSQRDGPLSGRPSARPGRPMGGAVRGPVSLVRPLLLGPRLPARSAAVPAGGRRVPQIATNSPAMRPRRASGRSQRRGRILRHRLEPDQPLRHGRQGRLAELAAKRGRADPRSHAPDGVQHGRPQPLRPPPNWLAEGLAMLFEAPGVYDSPQLHPAWPTA